MRPTTCALRAMALGALLVCAPPAAAHRLAPSLLELRERPEASGAPGVDVRWKVSLLAPTSAALEPELPAHCERRGEAAVESGAGAATLRLRLDCGTRGLVGARVGVAGLAGSGSDVLLRIELADGRRIERLLRGSAPALVVPERARARDVLLDYLRLGAHHIGTGPDHLLFVLGLVLLVAGRRRLLYTVSAFTLGHSATLALAVLGYVRFPVAAIEVAIAASLFAVAVELARGEQAPASALRRHPEAIAFSFGLLHGLGFAGALTEIGLPAEAIPLALFAFNLGIELAQIAFVLLALAVRAGLRAALPRPAWLAQVPVYAIGTLAAFWCLERAAGLVR